MNWQQRIEKNKVNKYFLTGPLKVIFCQTEGDTCKMLAQNILFWDPVLDGWWVCIRLTLKQIIIVNSGKNMRKEGTEVTWDLAKLRRNWRGFYLRSKGISLSEIPVFIAFPWGHAPFCTAWSD